MDYLKIDIEGFENKVIKAIVLDEVLQNVKQIGLEVRNGYFPLYSLNFTFLTWIITMTGEVTYPGFAVGLGWRGRKPPYFEEFLFLKRNPSN